MKAKNINTHEAFRLLDTSNTGLLSFGVFCHSIDSLSTLSQFIKEKLFARLDTMSIGLVSFDQFQDLLKKSNVKLRDAEFENKIQDSFEWEQ